MHLFASSFVFFGCTLFKFTMTYQTAVQGVGRQSLLHLMDGDARRSQSLRKVTLPSNVLFARIEKGVRCLWGQKISKNTCIWRDVFPLTTTVFATEAQARAGQPKDSKYYEPTEILQIGVNAWVNSCLALRDGCLTQMVNIPDAPGGASNARLRWNFQDKSMSLWSTKDIVCGPIIVSSYGRSANKHVRKSICN